jgi:two-component system, LytTR family, response regulator
VLRAFIIEDEEKGRENLMGSLAKHCPEVEVIGYAESISQALKQFKKPSFHIDVAFLDIELSDGMVFELLEELKEIEFDIIFISAFAELAWKGFKYSAIDYIPKPIDSEALKSAVSRVQPRVKAKTRERLEVFNQTITNPNNVERISISALDSIYFVSLKEIIRLEAQDNYTHIYLSTGEKITSSKTMRVYEDMLEHRNFFRIHKTHIINVNFIRKFMKGDGGYVIMDDGIQIDVSRRRRPIFIEFLKTLNNEL